MCKITRLEARKFAGIQLDGNAGLHDPIRGGKHKGGAFGYGKQDIEQLLDKIYGFDSNGKEVE